MTARRTMTRRSLALGGLGGAMAAGAGVVTGVLPGRAELKFVSALPQRPRVVAYGPGAHTRAYWDGVTSCAFAFVGAAL